MRSRHHFVWATSSVNNRTSGSIVTVQSLVAWVTVILRSNHPDNHIVTAIGGRNKWRTATPVGPCGDPIADNRGRVGCCNAESFNRAPVGSIGGIGNLVGPIGDGRLEDAAASKLG